MKKLVLYLLFSILMHFCAFSQQIRFQGIVVNGQTGSPIGNVNLKIPDTGFGTSTNNEGRFDLILVGIPAVVEITCIGYKPVSIEISKVLSTPVEILMQPSIQDLEGITISTKKAFPVFEDPDYSVLDYEMLDDNLLVLVFRYQLKRSELLLLTRWGDTLSQTTLPDLPPSRLYKDPLGNVHYFSGKGNAYQCFYNKSDKRIDFIYKFSVDTILKTFATFQFIMNKRLFFMENAPNNFSTQLGCIDNKNGKRYLHVSDNRNMAKNYYSDLNSFLEPGRHGDIFPSDADMRAFELFYKPKWEAMMVKAGPDRIAVFDFTTDTLRVLNSDWKTLSVSAFSFHKTAKTNLMTSIVNSFSANQWKWRWNIYTDDYSGKVYTSFERRGRIKLGNIDLNTGEIAAEYELPVLFVEKIEIYKNEAFFKYKETGEGEKWRLYKMRL